MKVNHRIWVIIGMFALFLLLLTFGIHSVLRNNALGFDYMFYWHAGRGLFQEGLSPYSMEITRRIQVSAYGRPALPGEYPFPFPYPLPILFVPFPLYFLSYDWSQAAWMAVNLLAPLAMGLLVFQRAPKWLSLSLVLFYQMTFTWIIGNYALLIGLICITVFYTLINPQHLPAWTDILSGIALAWLTNKPQMIWLFVGLALFFALRKRRWFMIGGFGAGLVGLHLAALAWLPDWPAQWWNMARIYPQESAHIPSLVTYLDYFLPSDAARTASIVLALPAVGVTTWLFWRWWRGQFSALLLLAWCGLVNSLSDVSALTPDQIILLVPVFLWAVYQRKSVGLMIGWFLAIMVTYIFFLLSLLGVIPDAVDRGPLLLYITWLVFIWRRESVAHLKAPPGTILAT